MTPEDEARAGRRQMNLARALAVVQMCSMEEAQQRIAKAFATDLDVERARQTYRALGASMAAFQRDHAQRDATEAGDNIDARFDRGV